MHHLARAVHTDVSTSQPARRRRRAPRAITLGAGLATAAAVGVGGYAVAQPPAAMRAPSGGERPVIAEVEGDAANGFDITYTDGTSIYPPTDSEARAECSEYDTRVARVRCRVEVATWYRDLGDLQASLAWVRAQEG